MAITVFEFVVAGPPLSVNTAKSQPRKHRSWQERIGRAAKEQWLLEQRSSAAIPTLQPVEISITTYYTALALDVDNVIKPILDSLKGILYVDDKQIYKLTSIRIDLNLNPGIDLSSALLASSLKIYSELIYVELNWEESEKL